MKAFRQPTLIQKLDQMVRSAMLKPATHIVTGVVVLIVDLLTGPFLMFPILFVLPVVFSAWFCNRRLSMVLSVALPVVRAYIAAVHEMYHPMFFVISNALVRITVLCLLAYLVSRTAAQTRELNQRVKILEGILPICSFCKRIRDDQQNWQQLETYISQLQPWLMPRVRAETLRRIF